MRRHSLTDCSCASDGKSCVNSGTKWKSIDYKTSRAHYLHPALSTVKRQSHMSSAGRNSHVRRSHSYCLLTCEWGQISSAVSDTGNRHLSSANILSKWAIESVKTQALSSVPFCCLVVGGCCWRVVVLYWMAMLLISIEHGYPMGIKNEARWLLLGNWWLLLTQSVCYAEWLRC